MKTELNEIIRNHTIPAVVGGRDVLCLNEAAIGHLISDLQKLFKKEREPPKVKSTEETIDCLIEYMNEVWGSAFRRNTESNRSFVRARLNDGISADDIKSVIDWIGKKWASDPVMSKFLRPMTVFRPSKFEGYLSEANRQTRQGLIVVRDAYGARRTITQKQLADAEPGFFTIIY